MHWHVPLLKFQKFLLFLNLERLWKVLLHYCFLKTSPIDFYIIDRYTTLSTFPPILCCASKSIGSIHNIICLWAFSQSKKFLHLLDPPFCFLWINFPIELRGMILIILSECCIRLKGLALLHHISPLSLRLSMLINLPLYHLHDLLMLQGLLCKTCGNK